MILVIPNSVLKDSSSIFTESDFKKAAIKAVKGLGINLPSVLKNAKTVKVRFTSKSGAGRAIFLIKKTEDITILVLSKLKSSRVGQNMSPENPQFTKIITGAVKYAFADIKNKKTKVINLNY